MFDNEYSSCVLFQNSVCLFNEPTTRWCERSVAASFIQMICVMCILRPVTSTRRFTPCDKQPHNRKALLPHTEAAPLSLDLMLHCSSLLCGQLSVTVAWGENKTLVCNNRRHARFIISCCGEEEQEEGQERMGRALICFFFFSLRYDLSSS